MNSSGKKIKKIKKVKGSNVNPKRKVESLEKIMKDLGKINDIKSKKFDEETIKQINEDFENMKEELAKPEEVDGFFKMFKDYVGKNIENKRKKADIERLEKEKAYRESRGIPDNQYMPLGLSHQLQHEKDVANKKKALLGLGVAVGVGTGIAIHLPGPAPEITPEKVVKVAYLKHGANNTANLTDINSHAIEFNFSADNAMTFTDIDAKAHDLVDHFVQFDGGVDQDATKVTFDNEGGADVYIKGLNTNNSVTMELTYEQALQQLPKLLNGFDEIEIRTDGYIRAGSNPVYRNVDGTNIVNQTFALLGIHADPAKYRMNVTSQFDNINKTAKHGIKFIAKDDSVADFNQTGLSKEVMAQVNDILIDNHAGDDYQSMLEQINVWEGVHGVLNPIITEYTDLMIRERDRLQQQIDEMAANNSANNSALNNLTAHYQNILQNLTKIGYIDISSYESVEAAVQDITDKASDILSQDFKITDKKVFRYVYDNLPAEYKGYMIDDVSKLDALLDGSDANGEFQGFNLSIEGKVTVDNGSAVVDVTGTSLFDAVGAADDYASAGIPREAVERIILEAYKGQGALSAVPTERTLDKSTANLLYQGLGTIDQRNTNNGTTTDYQKQFMGQDDYNRLFDNNNSNEELGNITLKIYQAPNAPVELVYEKVQADGTKINVPAVKSKEWLEAAYEIIGE